MNNKFNLDKIKKEYSENSFLSNIIKELNIEKVIRIKNNQNNRKYIKHIWLGYTRLELKPYINSLEKYSIKSNQIASGAFGEVYNTTNPNIIFKKVKDPKKVGNEFKSLIFHYLLLEKYKNTKKKKYLCKLIEFGSLYPYTNKNYNYYYVVMEKFGKGLSNYNNTLKFNNLFKIFYQCCDSVLLIHDLEYLHLDIKPGNFLVDNNKIKIIDFGIVNKNDFETINWFGTVTYIANDWLLNSKNKKNTRLTYHHDIFSLGCMFIELLYKFIINKKIFMACPLILMENKELYYIRDIEDYIFNKRISYNDEMSYISMCETINYDLKNDLKNDLNNNFKINNKKFIQYIDFSINLIKLMCHPNPKERCNNIRTIINMLDNFFKNKNIKINENENIIVRRIN